MKYAESTIFLTGQAHPGKDDVIASQYNVFTLCLVVDTEGDLIVDVACNSVLEMTREFIRDMFCGKSLTRDLDLLLSEIRARFFGTIQRTLAASVRDAQNRYFLEFPDKRGQRE